MKAVAVLVLATCQAFAGVVAVTVSLSPADVGLKQLDRFAMVSLTTDQPGVVATWTTEPGKPLLPVLSGNVLIPAGADVERIEVLPLERVELAQGVSVYPVQPMRPLSQFNDVPFVEPDKLTYSSEAKYPAEALTAVPAGSKAGFRIAGFLYCPFEYFPASGRLVLISRARVIVSYHENSLPVTVLTPSQLDFAAEDVARLVANPKDLAHFAPPAVEKDAKETDVLMFTSSTLAPALAGIRSWLMRKGYFTEIVRTDTISLPGRDVPEKMRNLVKRKFQDEGLKYVILAGDTQHCKLRYGYLPYSTYNVPADMYFGDLDGTWDANNNNNFGEMTGDSVDLFHDVYVGRLPLDDATNAANFLRKDTTYEICPDTAYLNNVILPGEVLWSNIDYHGSIVNQNIARMLNAAWPWEVDSGLNIGSSRVISGVNAGRHLFHFAGHGSATAFGSTFSTSNLASLTNVAKPCIVNTMACDCGWFDQSTDCLGEQFINITNGGAVSTMFNARYGWGAPPCQGPNENMNCAFFHNYLAGMTQGRAHGLAKDFLRNESFSQMTARWAMYTNTLQGDPTMIMWRSAPEQLAVTHPDTIPAMPQVLEVSVDCGDEPVLGARVAVTHLGELVGRAVTNPLGTAHVPLATIEDTWTLGITVTAQDARIYQSVIRTKTGSNAPLVVIARSRVADPNGRLDPYEESDLYCVVANRGAMPADSVSGTLTTTSPWVTVINATSSYGTIAAGDTAAGTAYRVAVDRNCPHGHRAAFQLTTAAGTSNWTSDFELVVGLPHSRGGIWATLDTGDYCLSVCGNGGIGTTRWRGEGYGFIYPKSRMWSAASMMHGSFMLGTDSTWVADNFYGTPGWHVCPQDFVMVDSVRPVYPPELGDKELITTFTDANHPQPRNVRIVHRAYGSARPTHKDFVILEYRIFNTDSVPLESLYTAVCCDFRTPGWNVNDSFDFAGTDSLRNLAYVRSAASGETLAMGIRHIYPPTWPGFANCINEWTYVANGFTKAEKIQFMNGTLRSTTGTTRANWDAMSSSGPHRIPAGDSIILAWVLCGSRTVTQLLAVSDTAALWYSPPVGVSSPEHEVGPSKFGVYPQLFAGELRFSRPHTGAFRATLTDALGRVVASRTFPAGEGQIVWRPDVSPGVYFLRSGALQAKVLSVR
ncbi:MAG: C25 family cysteine peptidase [candidate division WOR-3 bacterium]